MINFEYNMSEHLQNRLRSCFPYGQFLEELQHINTIKTYLSNHDHSRRVCEVL